ncbi:MAG: nitroreductase family protein [Lawsonibacter sp.]|jgi:nitroreductase
MNKNMDLLNLILDRRSCKEYRPDPLDRPTLAAIVEAGRYAPSGMNRQKNHFYVITDPQVLEGITQVVKQKMPGFAQRDCRYAAPALVVVTNQKDNSMAIQDAACAMENMMLAACAMGVASRWINQPFALSDDPDLRGLLTPYGLTDQERICASLALGYPVGPLFPGRTERTGNPVTWVSPAK